MNILHINCNYAGNHVHRNMIEALSKNTDLNNKVFVPVYKIPNDNFKDNVVIAKCFHKWDRIFFYYKTKKIQNSIFHNYDFKEINIVHAYTLFTDGNVAYEINKKFNIPYIVTIRNTDLNSFLKYKFYLKNLGKKILENAKAIIFISKVYEKELFEKYYNEELKKKLEDKIYVIPNGIDDFWLQNKYIPNKKIKDKVNIIYAGIIDKNKNILTTQKAINILRRHGYEVNFTIVGKVADKKIFKAIMKDKHTTYIESKPKDELLKIYRKNDIFVMPSFTESFGMVYIEAISQGLPVIYSKGQGFDEQFEEGIVGYGVNAKSDINIAENIEKILNTYKLFKNISSKTEKFDWKYITDIYFNIYIKIGELYETKIK